MPPHKVLSRRKSKTRPVLPRNNVTMPDATPTRTALVTGGARRVGRSIVLHLARAGWDVAATYRTSVEEISTLADAVERLGRRFVQIRADFADPGDASERVAKHVRAQFDRLDLLVHNASVYEPDDLGSLDLATLRRDFAVHVETPLLLTRALRPLLETAGGSVVTMTDVDLDRSRPSYLSYQITKAALANLTKNLARELAPRVTVNAIAPGAILWAEGMTNDEKAAYLKRVPLDRSADAGEVPGLIEFLATRGRYLTGQTLRMDGGRHLR